MDIQQVAEVYKTLVFQLLTTLNTTQLQDQTIVECAKLYQHIMVAYEAYVALDPKVTDPEIREIMAVEYRMYNILEDAGVIA
jgi:hypothetical protein